MKQSTYFLQMTLIRLLRGALSAWYEWARDEYENSKKPLEDT